MTKSIRKTAMTLAEELRRFPWFRFVGIGEDKGKEIFIVYVSQRNLKTIKPLVPKTWEGVSVVVRYIQQPIPA
jgi:hypothetical protein